MAIPSKYDYLELIDIKQQILLLELLFHKKMRISNIYKLNIFNHNNIYANIEKLILRNLIKKEIINSKEKYISLTPKGLNFAYIIASDEKRFNTCVQDFIIVCNIGNKKFDLLKKYIEYRLIANEF